MKATVALLELSSPTSEPARASTSAKMSGTPSKIHSIVMTRRFSVPMARNPLTMLRV